MSKIEIENVLQPGKTYRVDRAKFTDMRRAVLEILADAPEGLTPKTIIERVVPRLSPLIFPGGEKAGWWVKSVQLDLEAKGVLRRTAKPPVTVMLADAPATCKASDAA